jgi:hypothetical protein
MPAAPPPPGPPPARDLHPARPGRGGAEEAPAPASSRALLADAAASLAAALPPAESPEAALAAEACRLAWRPARLRLLLLAESHMATGAAELACGLRLPPGVDWPGPRRFVRHVYCAGYGEPELIDPPPPPRNFGTAQYWRLLCATEDAAMPALPGLRKAAGAGLARRLGAKAALLHRLRARGIWLTDASLPALAGPGGWRATPAQQAAALEGSWRLYHGALLPGLEPAHVVVIGLGVARILGPRLDATFPGRWSAVPQPNARLPAARAAALRRHLAAAAARFAPEAKD